jgi:uncharacterized protein YecE (DUF72 family)
VIHDIQRAGEWRVSAAGIESGAISLSHEELFAVSAGWLYLRLHGAQMRYAGEYFDGGLRPWVTFAKSALNRGLPTRVYFNNSTAGAAARDAIRFSRLIRAAESET